MDRASKLRFKEELYEEFAAIGKALGSSVRLQIIELLAQGEQSVEGVARALDLPVANVSQHLQVLRKTRLAACKKRGPFVYYSLSDTSVFQLWSALRSFGEAQVAEIDRLVESYVRNRSELAKVGPDELLRRLDEGATVIDVRPKGEYDQGHIAGARSIPLEELEARLDEIPVGVEVVAYCRGPYCVFADEAVSLLKSRGLGASKLSIGLPDWRQLGLPVEQSYEMDKEKRVVSKADSSH